MENNKEHHIERTNFDAFVHAVGSEIEQAQVRLITAANAQMLFHYWKMGNYILYHQNLQGWGSKIIKQLAKAIRFNYPEKKGYSERNLTYMCQFARSYPLNVLRSFIDTDARLSVPSIQNVTDEVLKLNNGQFTQELTAQIQSTDSQLLEFTQEPLAQIQNVAKTVSAIYRITIEDIEKLFLASPVARINWASHVIMLNNSLPLGVKYWYMKQSVEMGWSSNVLKIQIETNLYNRQISNNKVNNFTATLPAPQSDLANYLLKDPYIFDLAGAKEKADERDIEEQLVLELEQKYRNRILNQSYENLKQHNDQQRIITGLVLLFSLSLLVAGLLYLRKWRENAALKMREAEAEKESLGRACRELQEQLGTVGDRVDTDDEQERQLFDALEERMVVLRNWVDKAETMKPALFMKSFRDYMTVNVKSKHALSDLQYVVNRKYFGVVDYLKAHYPELRKQDLDLCCLLCFGFSQHGICYLYNYEDIGSFYNKRSRLRKKLGLPPERTLESFIAELLAELVPKEE